MKPLTSLAAFAALCLLATTGARAQAPDISATQTDGFDANAAGRATPGGTVTYTIEIENSGNAPANGVVLANPTPANTTFVPGSLKTTCVAIDDDYACLGNVSITIAAPGVLANDLDPDGGQPDLVATAITNGPTTQGGRVTLAANGGFTYDPPAGFNGVDTFVYTLVDLDGNTDTATVSVTVSGMIWFINANAPSNGDGRLSTPFNNLASFQAINNGTGNNPKPGHSIFLYESANDYTGGVSLLGGAGGGQRLIGQDATGTLATLAGVVPPPGSAALPAMNAGNGTVVRIVNASGNAVSLGQNSRIHGFTAGNASGAAIFGSGAGTIQVSDVAIQTNGRGLELASTAFGAGSAFTSISSTGGTSGISLDAVTGTANLGGGTLSGHSTNAFLASGGGGSVNYSGSISKTSGSGAAVRVQSKTGGTVTLSGPVSAVGVAGVSIDGNSSGTNISLSGTLSLSSGTNPAFSATGGGVVTATGSNNTLATTSGRALTVTGTSIGAGGLVFRSISANGAVNGILLENTGTSGGLTVTGEGNTTLGGNNSGGIIENTSGNGIHLFNTRSPSFTNLQIRNTFRSGVWGRQVTNFTFRHSRVDKSGLNASNNPVDGTAAGVGVSNIAFNTTASGNENNLDGTVVIEGNQLSNAWYHGVEIFNYAGTISDLAISGNTITTPTLDSQTMGSGISVIAYGGAATVASITRGSIHGNTVSNLRGGVGIQVQGGNSNGPGAPAGTLGVAGHATNLIAVTNNVISGQSAANPTRAEGIVALVGGVGQGNFDLSNNQITHTLGTSISNSAFGNAVVTAKIDNNTIVSNNSFGSQGIGAGTSITGGFPTNSPRYTAAITNNNISQTDGNGILVVARDSSDGKVVVKINQNTVAAPLGGVRPGIRIDAGNNNGDNDVDLEIVGNTSAGSGDPGSTMAPGIGLRKNGTSTTVNAFGIEGLPSSPAGTPVVENHVNSLNPGSAAGGPTSGGVGGTLLISASSGFTAVNVPMLFAPPLALEEPGTEAGSTAEVRSLPGGDEAEAAAPTEAGLPAPATEAADADPLAATGLVAPDAPEAPVALRALTFDELERHFAAARNRWEGTGLRDEQSASLERLRFEVSDLPGLYLAEYREGLVRVDREAAGNGWFLDPSPEDDRDFERAGSVLLAKDPQSAAATRVDLLTVLMHEMGHALGFPDTYAAEDRDRIMYGFLTLGERRLPRPGEAETVPAPNGSVPGFLTAPLSIGTLPPGKSITVTFQVTIDSPTAVTEISSQGTVSGDNFANVLTDDPALPGNADPTLTPVEQPPSVSDFTVNGLEDTVLNFTALQFSDAFTDANGDSLAAVRVTSLPANGTLRLGVAAVNVNDEIPAASLGSLNFNPAADWFGSTSFAWTGSDGQSFAAPGALATLNIAPVNDPPTLDPIPDPVTILEDAGLQTIQLSGITAGGGETQTLTVTAVSGNPSLIQNPVLVSYTSPATNGSLSYTPQPDQFGTALITVTVQDDGGTANGGIDTFSRQFTVTVDPVADTPSVTDAATLPNTQTTSGLVISRNPADGGEVTHFRISNVQNGTVYLGDGTTPVTDGGFVTFAEGSAGLRFTPAANFQGNATFEVEASLSATIGGVGGDPVTATIAVNEQVSIDTIDPGDESAEEGGDDGLFTFTRGGNSGELVALFELDPSSTASAATDFVLSGAEVVFDPSTGSGTVTFPDGENTVQLTLVALEEIPNAAEADETVRLKVVPVPGTYLAGTPDHATVTIAQNGFTVTNLNDSGEGSLRQAIQNANELAGIDSVVFSDGEGGSVDFFDGTPRTIELTSGPLGILSDLSLAGPGAASLSVERSAAPGTPDFRVFEIAGGGVVQIGGLSVAGGHVPSGPGGGILATGTALTLSEVVVRDNLAGGNGGGIAKAGGTLTVRDSVLRGNQSLDSGGGFASEGGTTTFINTAIHGNEAAEAGGGFLESGSLTLVSCAVHDNTATGDGGGLSLLAGDAQIANSTISGNSATGSGGGVMVHGANVGLVQTTVADNGSDGSGGGVANATGTVALANSILADNRGPAAARDLSGAFTDSGHNLVGIVDGATGISLSTLTGTFAEPLDPQLAPLEDNGGPTLTHAILGTSPALNSGSAALVPTDTFDLDGDSDVDEPIPFDQRGPGFDREIGIVDIGAYELQRSVSIAALDASKAEGSGSGTTPFTFTVSRSGDTEGPVTASYAVSGSGAHPADAADFGGTLPSGQVTIPDGESSVVLTIEVSRDDIVEADEEFTVTLADPDNDYILVGATATGAILNDDIAALTLSGGGAAAEGDSGTSERVFTATLSHAVQGGFSVSYTTVDGSATVADGDYLENSGSLVFSGSAAGETRTIVVLVNGDTKVEADETFSVTLGTVSGAPGPVNVAGSPQVATITNDDSALVALAGDVSQPEGAGPMVFTVTLSQPVDIPVSVDYSTSDGSAVAPGDYTAVSGTLVFPAGSTVSQTVSVPVVNDTEHELDETFTLHLDNLVATDRSVTLGNSTATGTIENDDELVVTLTATDDTADETLGETGTWTLSRNSVVGDSVVQLQIDASSTASAADWTQTGASFASLEPGATGTATIPEGETSVEIVLTPLLDLLAEPDETVVLNLLPGSGYTVGSPDSATITIAANGFGVTNTSDSGEGSLRQAVWNAANLPGANTVTFSDGSEGSVDFTDAIPETITLLSGPIVIEADLAIAGTGADRLAVSGNHSGRVVEVLAGASASIEGLTVTAGAGDTGAIANGGVLALSGVAVSGNSSSGILNLGNLTLSGSVLADNEGGTEAGGLLDGSASLTLIVGSAIHGNSSADDAGGLSLSGETRLVNVTLSGNSGGSTGGIANSGLLRIEHGTIAANTALDDSAGGVRNLAGGEIHLANSIVAAQLSGDDLLREGGTIHADYTLVGDGLDAVNGSGSNNLTGDPLLGPLQDNGGASPTHALLVGSPAIDAGDPAFDPDAFTPSLSNDQRGAGFSRLVRGAASSSAARVDLGAYELLAAPLFTDDDLSLHSNADPLDLFAASGVLPPGGVFSGTGVDGASGTFDPAGLGLGSYTVTYTVTDANGNTNSTDLTITVTEVPSLTVTTLDDIVDPVDGHTSLREALAYAASLGGAQTVDFSTSTAGGAVDFHDGTPRSIVLDGAELVIDGEVAIAGPGMDLLAVSGDLASRVFAVAAGSNASLADLTVREGSSGDPLEPGGGILHAGDHLELTSVRLDSNEAPLHGGGLYNAGGTVILSLCEVTGNAAGTGGGLMNSAGGHLEIVDSHITGNTATLGGGIAQGGDGAGTPTDQLVLLRSTVSGNRAEGAADVEGGGILVATGVARIVNATLSGNRAETSEPLGTAHGGGLAVGPEGTLELAHSTVTANTAEADSSLGGGIAVAAGGQATLGHGIVAGNTVIGAAGIAPDLAGTLVSDGYNLVGDSDGGTGWSLSDLAGTSLDPLDPVLGPLQDNGGPTPTHALLLGSPAIDAGDPAFDPSASSPPLGTDQRGAEFPRVERGSALSAEPIIDIGAYELLAVPRFARNLLSVRFGSSAFDLADASGVTPPGGIFSGTGVNGQTFDPAGLAPGDYAITYTVTDPNGATNFAELVVRVTPLPSRLELERPKRFPVTKVGRTSRQQRLRLENVGGESTERMRFQARGPGARDYRIAFPPRSPLAPGASKVIRVRFSPKSAGLRRAVISAVDGRQTVRRVLSNQAARGFRGVRVPDRE